MSNKAGKKVRIHVEYDALMLMLHYAYAGLEKERAGADMHLTSHNLKKKVQDLIEEERKLVTRFHEAIGNAKVIDGA